MRGPYPPLQDSSKRKTQRFTTLCAHSYSDSAHISISAPFVKVSTDYSPLGGGIDAGPCQGKGATGDEGLAHDPSGVVL